MIAKPGNLPPVVSARHDHPDGASGGARRQVVVPNPVDSQPGGVENPNQLKLRPNRTGTRPDAEIVKGPVPKAVPDTPDDVCPHTQKKLIVPAPEKKPLNKPLPLVDAAANPHLGQTQPKLRPDRAPDLLDTVVEHTLHPVEDKPVGPGNELGKLLEGQPGVGHARNYAAPQRPQATQLTRHGDNRPKLTPRSSNTNTRSSRDRPGQGTKVSGNQNS